MRIKLKKNKNCSGFTLAELLISILIFSMMMTALVSIYGTINKHMFQSYRQNILKNNLAIAIKTMQVNLMTATRVDRPTFGNSENELAFVTNVDKQTGCSPVNPAVLNTWHYFCAAACPAPNAAKQCLYYHTDTLSSDTGGCPCAVTHLNIWTGILSYPVGFCGIGGGGTVTQLTAYSDNIKVPSMGRFFSRRSIDGIKEVDQVRMSLRAISSAKGARPIDITLGTVVHTQTTP